MSGGLTALAITVSNDDMDVVEILIIPRCWILARFAGKWWSKIRKCRLIDIWSYHSIWEKQTFYSTSHTISRKFIIRESIDYLQEDDITKMLAATTHIGSDNSETTMEQYIFKKKTDGINIINLKKTWEKLVLAARAIAAVENPQVNRVI